MMTDERLNGILACAYCVPENEHKELDPALLREMARLLRPEFSKLQAEIDRLRQAKRSAMDVMIRAGAMTDRWVVETIAAENPEAKP
jgi:hypothetical protein